ncbi:hypothetical protein [Burkholderia multivorans]|uniref:hypothetical protein n=1 Tax=Burkholderia multivorans TaxID=87883 RepID=UPI0021C0273A|nr:hypothetical protein [Burkholderia multivorans]
MRHGDYDMVRRGAARGKGRCIRVPAYAAAHHVKPVPGTSIQNRRKTVACSPLGGGRSASRIAFFDGAPASTAIGYATCAEPRDTKIREMSLRIQLLGSVDRTLGSAFADRSIAYASHRRTRIARCHSQPRCSSAAARDCSDPSGLATLHCGRREFGLIVPSFDRTRGRVRHNLTNSVTPPQSMIGREMTCVVASLFMDAKKLPDTEGAMLGDTPLDMPRTTISLRAGNDARFRKPSVI